MQLWNMVDSLILDIHYYYKNHGKNQSRWETG